MNIKRLKMLRHMLRWHWLYFPRVKFNIETWNSTQTCYVGDKGFCKSAGCALGSAALWKPFNKQGLKLNDIRLPQYQGESDYHAGMYFFDISYPQSTYLFDPQKYSKPVYRRDVIVRINKLLKQKD